VLAGAALMGISRYAYMASRLRCSRGSHLCEDDECAKLLGVLPNEARRIDIQLHIRLIASCSMYTHASDSMLPCLDAGEGPGTARPIGMSAVHTVEEDRARPAIGRARPEFIIHKVALLERRVIMPAVVIQCLLEPQLLAVP
jgi:hypothetical protein